jgi:hypothetical protein
MNFSNSTQFIRENASSSSPPDFFVILLTYLDYLLRPYALLVHCIYFLIVALVKDLRSLSLIYIHQINLFGCLFCFHFMLYITSRRPSTGNIALDDLLCTMSELSWSLLKFLRSFSILILATYRLVAVFKSEIFKQWSKSVLIVLLSFAVEALVCVFLTIVAKLAFGTTGGEFLCYDGFSENLNKAIAYFVFTSVLGIVLPNVTVILFYVLTMKRLIKISLGLTNANRLNKLSKKSTNSLSLPISSKSFANSQQSKLAKQFLIINIVLILSSISFLFINIANLFNEFSSRLIHYRMIVRSLAILFQSIVPIVSIIYHPKIKEYAVKIFNKMCQNKISIENSTSSSAI